MIRQIIDWTTIDQDDLMRASIEAFHRGDTTKLAALIQDHLGLLPALSEPKA